MAEWDEYSCVIPSKQKGFTLNHCSELTKVYHVTHIPEARRILEDGAITSGLIYDESRLNKSRLCVCWVSANTWGNGSIYGNVQFSFEWDKLVDGRNIYWVEAMPDYCPTAYRFLLTDRDLSKSRHLSPYDPEDDKGPLRLNDDVWYWNDNFTSEFMIEADLSLSDCNEVSFVSHHPTICRLSTRNCGDKNLLPQTAGGCILSYVLGTGLHRSDHLFLRQDENTFHFSGEHCVSGIWRALGSKKENFDGVIKSKASRQSVLCGALAIYGHGKRTEALEIIGLLQSQEIFEKALKEVVANHFDWDDYELPD